MLKTHSGKPKDKHEQSLVDLLLLEKIPLAGISRATGVSKSWLQNYANVCYELVPQVAKVMPKAPGKLSVQMDELWSFVDDKGNKQWVWLAIDTHTREVIGCSYWRPFSGRGDRIVAIIAGRVQAMCCCLYRLLGGLQDGGSGLSDIGLSVKIVA